MKELMARFYQRTGVNEKSFNYLMLKGYVDPAAVHGAFIETDKAFHQLWKTPPVKEDIRQAEQASASPAATNSLENYLILLCDAVDIVSRCYSELPLNLEQQDAIRKALIQIQQLHKKAVLGEKNE